MRPSLRRLLIAPLLPLLLGASPPGATSVRPFIPKGYEMLSLSCGDLNHDAFRDCVLVLKSRTSTNAEGTHPILVLLGQADGGFRQAARNDRALHPSASDLLETLRGVTLKNGLCTLEEVIPQDEGSSATFYATFRYDPERQGFLLHRIDLSADESAPKFHYTSENFGTIPFESYTPESALSAVQSNVPSPPPAEPAPEPAPSRTDSDELPERVTALLPEGTEIERAFSGFLNTDASLDYALVVHPIDAPRTGARSLLLVLGRPEGGYLLASRNDQVIRPRVATRRGRYDPFTGITFQDGAFTVEHAYRAPLHRRLSLTFKYSPSDGQFYLLAISRTRSLVATPEKVSSETRTEKDFGTVTFEQTPAPPLDE